MSSYKKITLALLALLFVSAVITIATRSSYSQSNAHQKKTVKVLRRQEQLGQPPTAQEIAAAQDGPQPAQQEREFEDKIPKHLPIKVKVKNLKNEKWARDLEIEVENRSDKPIYFLLLLLDLPDVLTENNHKLGFPLVYGRGDLVDFSAPLRPDDVPIKPGESYVFKIPEQLQQGWERFVIRRGLSKDMPKKVRLIFQILNFGDGTGFGTTGGVPVDTPLKLAANSHARRQQIEERAIAGLNKPPNCSLALSFQPSTFFLPAKFLPVNFSPTNASVAASTGSLMHSDICCPGLPCSRLKLRKVSCCGEIFKAFYAGCTETGGFCSTAEADRDVPCNDSAGTYCIEDILAPCSPVEPTPIPTPTPPPTPTPTPTPTPLPCPTPDFSTQPNPSCTPLPVVIDGCIGYGYIWYCQSCPVGQPQVDNYSYPQSNGCPAGYYNNGNNCCVPLNPTPTPTPTLTAGGGSGRDGIAKTDSTCTDYWWVYYDCVDGACTVTGRAYAGCW